MSGPAEAPWVPGDRYEDTFGRLRELTDIATRFYDQHTSEQHAAPQRRRQLARDFSRAWSAREQEWERLRETGLTDEQIARDWPRQAAPQRERGRGSR